MLEVWWFHDLCRGLYNYEAEIAHAVFWATGVDTQEKRCVSLSLLSVSFLLDPLTAPNSLIKQKKTTKTKPVTKIATKTAFVI